MRRSSHIQIWTVWFLVGFATALLLQRSVIVAFGGDTASLLHVGSGSRYRNAIEQELGNIPEFPSIGHDGQTFYLIARDPFGKRGIPDLISGSGYRYRRILLPLLAGLGGLASPRTTLTGLALWSAVGFGLGVAGVGLLTRLLSLRSWPIIGILGNPGYWFSVMLLTSDALAGGLAFSGLALWFSQRKRPRLVAFAAAALSKEYYLLVPLALATWEFSRGHRRQALALILEPSIPVVAWSVWVTLIVGGGFSPMSNLTWVGVGIATAASTWLHHPGIDQILSLGTLLVLAAALGSTFWKSGQWLRNQLWMWGGLALISSRAVWDLGNNSTRVLAPIWVFGFLAIESVLLSYSLQTHSRDQPPSTSRRNLPV